MAARVGGLIDTKTGKARDGAIVKVDDHTVKLKLSDPDIAIIANFTDYPGLIVHRSFDAGGADPVAKPIGTGAFELVSYAVGSKAEANAGRMANGGAAKLCWMECNSSIMAPTSRQRWLPSTPVRSM
jgi:extracellular solute-binding protein (family 5)